VSPLKIKIPSKNLGKQRCAERFNSGVKWVITAIAKTTISEMHSFELQSSKRVASVVVVIFCIRMELFLNLGKGISYFSLLILQLWKKGGKSNFRYGSS
jgi:hypothetical protein